MARTVQIGIAIPQTFPGRPPDVKAIREFLAAADGAGIDSLWVEEQTRGVIPILDPMELLAYAAALTTRPHVGCAVFLSALRNPVHLAKSLATIDHLAEGRLVAGLGLGEATEYEPLGLPPGGRPGRFEEGIAVMKRLWTEPSVTFDGEFYRLREVAMEPKPVQAGGPPLWFGGHAPAAIRRAVRLGDGFIGAGSSSTGDFAAQVRLLKQQLRDAGRDPEAFPVAKRVYLAVDRDRSTALARLREWFRRFYGDYIGPEPVAVWGDVSECADRLREVVAAGASLLLLNPVYDEVEQLRLILDGVAPALA